MIVAIVQRRYMRFGSYTFVGISGWFEPWYLAWGFPYAFRGGEATLSTAAITLPVAIALLDHWYLLVVRFNRVGLLMLVVAALVLHEVWNSRSQLFNRNQAAACE